MNRCSTNNDYAVHSLKGTPLNQVDDYKYLGSFLSSSEKDFKVRKGMAWSACNKMHNIWSSQLSRELKINIFRATVEPILLYGSETWTLTRKVEKHLDGTYTRLLMRVQNLSWRDHHTLNDIYGKLPRVTTTVQFRRAQFAGHCFRADKEIVSSLVLWNPTPRMGRGRRLSFPDVISRDTGVHKEDLNVAMQDRERWREIVKSIVSTEVER